MSVRPAKIQISLGIRPVWSEYSLSAWRNLGPLATHLSAQRRLWSDWADAQADLSLRFAYILLVLSYRGSYKEHSVVLNISVVQWTSAKFTVVNIHVGWMDDLAILHPFTSFSVISGRLESFCEGFWLWSAVKFWKNLALSVTWADWGSGSWALLNMDVSFEPTACMVYSYFLLMDCAIWIKV